MRIIAFSCIGIEDVLSQDIKRLIGKDCEIREGACIVDCASDEFARIAYFCQSCERAGILLKEGYLADDPSSISIEDISLDIKGAFSIKCSIRGDKIFKSSDIALDLCDKIKAKTGRAVTYKGASTIIYVMVSNDRYYITIDAAEHELSKRDYKVFANKSSLRGTIAYAVTQIAGISKDELIIDPFCRSGEIVLEAAHYLLGKSVHFYAKDKFCFERLGIKAGLELLDSEAISGQEIRLHALDSNMANVKAAEKNAKIAGLNKAIGFSRTSVDDLDIKYDNEIDKIITQLPAIGQGNEKRILETYRAFFGNCPKIMKPLGSIVCVGVNIGKAIGIAKEAGYSEFMQRKVMQGKEELLVLAFRLSKK